MTPSNGASADVFALLDQERANFLRQYARVPEARRADAPAEGVWSAVEIAEHVIRVTSSVARLLVMRASEPLSATPEEIAAAQLTAEKAAWVRVPSTKVVAPERARPAGKVQPSEVPEQMAAAHAGLRAAFDATDPAVLDGSVHPHPFIGPLTLRAWVELVGLHDARHAQQMAEVADHWLAQS